MDGQRQYTYRWLLYKATLDTRPLRYIKLGWWQRLNPFVWRDIRRQVRAGGYLAEWLHNLARYVYMDKLDEFDEQKFWDAYQWILEQNPDPILEMYRAEFDRHANASHESVPFEA